MIQIPFSWRLMMKEQTGPTRLSTFLFGNAGSPYDGCLLSLVQTNYVLIIGVKADAGRVATQFGQRHGKRRVFECRSEGKHLEERSL
jgi:hypothetical protein